MHLRIIHVPMLLLLALCMNFSASDSSVITKREGSSIGSGHAMPIHPSILLPAVIQRGEMDKEEEIDEHHHKRKEGEMLENIGPLHLHPNNLPPNLSFEDVIAARRDAIRYRIRNTSELHTEIEGSNEDEKDYNVRSFLIGLNDSMMHRIIILPKPFHFHIPIISKSYLESLKTGLTDILATNIENSETIRAEREEMDMEVPYPDLISIDINNSSRVSEFNYPVVASAAVDDPLLLPVEVAPIQQSDEESSYIIEKRDGVAVTNELLPRNTHMFHEGKKLDNMEDLLDQHPKLIPSVNRKRDYGLAGLFPEDSAEDELWSITLAGTEEETEAIKPDVVETKRSVKAVNFSQNAVDSILNHEDDFVKYHKKIKSHAEKLGIKPHEVFQAVIQGKALDWKKGDNDKAKEIHEIRRDFQAFFGAAEENGQTGSATDDSGTYKPFDSYMKNLKREKRGIKNWLRKLLGTEPTTTTAKPTVVLTGDPDLQVVIKVNRGKKGSSKKVKENKKDDKGIEKDKNGDTADKAASKENDKNKSQDNSKKGEVSPSETTSLEQIQVEVHRRKGRKKEKEEKIKVSSNEQEEDKEDSKIAASTSSMNSKEEEKKDSKTAAVSSEEESDKDT